MTPRNQNSAPYKSFMERIIIWEPAFLHPGLPNLCSLRKGQFVGRRGREHGAARVCIEGLWHLAQGFRNLGKIIIHNEAIKLVTCCSSIEEAIANILGAAECYKRSVSNWKKNIPDMCDKRRYKKLFKWFTRKLLMCLLCCFFKLALLFMWLQTPAKQNKCCSDNTLLFLR